MGERAENMIGRNRTWRLGCGQRGQNIIEMAIMTPLLLLILIGVLDFARVFNNYVIVTNASREGARYGSRFPADTAGTRQAAIDEAANSGVALTSSDVTVTFPNGTSNSGDRIVVRATYQMTTFMGSMIGYSNLTIGQATAMVIFGLPPPP